MPCASEDRKTRKIPTNATDQIYQVFPAFLEKTFLCLKPLKVFQVKLNKLITMVLLNSNLSKTQQAFFKKILQKEHCSFFPSYMSWLDILFSILTLKSL